VRILLATKDGDTLPLVFRLMEEGHTVRAWIENEKYGRLCDGLIPKLQKPQEIEAFDPQLILNLETSLPGKTEQWLRAGYPTLGGTRLAHELEADRFGALEFAREAGVLIPRTFPFMEGSEAIQRLRTDSTRMCCKFNEDGGDKFLSFLGKSNADVIHFIEKKYDPAKHKGLILQEYIEGPLELNCEGWFSRGELIWPMNAGMEQKRFLSGDLGPNTGCMSTLTWPLSERSHTPWTRGMLEKLKELEYTGPLDMAFKMGKDGKFYFLEFTPRAGINAVFGLVDLFEGNLGEWFAGVAEGTEREMPLRKAFSYILSVSVYPYPYEIPAVYLPGVEVRVPSLPSGANWWPFGVEEGKDGKIVTAPGYPLVGYLSVCDRSAGKAVDRAKVIAQEIEVTGKQYRDDGESLLEPLKRLQSLGVKVA